MQISTKSYVTEVTSAEYVHDNRMLNFNFYNYVGL